MIVELIGGPLDGAEYDCKFDSPCEIQFPVPARSGRGGYDSVRYFRRSQDVYVWEGLKENKVKDVNK